MTEEPILLLDIWTTPSFSLMILSAFFTFMSVGILIWYISMFNLEERGYTLFANGANYATLTVGGAVTAH